VFAIFSPMKWMSASSWKKSAATTQKKKKLVKETRNPDRQHPPRPIRRHRQRPGVRPGVSFVLTTYLIVQGLADDAAKLVRQRRAGSGQSTSTTSREPARQSGFIWARRSAASPARAGRR